MGDEMTSQGHDDQAIEIDGMWVWPDGFTFPVIRGGADEGDEGGGEADTDDGGGDEGGDAGEEGAAEEDDDFQIPEGDTFPRAVIEDARKRYGDERMKRKEYESQLEEWGGRDQVAKAVEIRNHLQTEDGVMDLFIEAGKAMGLTMAQISSVFNAVQAGEAEEAEDEDRVLTLKEAREIVRSEAVAPLQRQQEMQQEAQARRIVSDTCTELGISGDHQMLVLQMGDKYWDKDLSDPRKLQDAIKKGHADFLKMVEEQAQAYRKQKKDQKDIIPKTPNGAAGSAGIDPEPPKSVEEAIIRARKRLGVS